MQILFVNCQFDFTLLFLQKYFETTKAALVMLQLTANAVWTEEWEQNLKNVCVVQNW